MAPTEASSTATVTSSDGLRLEVERRAGDQPQLKAARVVDDLEEPRVVARQAQDVRAQAVVGDRDVGDLDRGGGVGVLRQAGQNRIQAHDRRQVLADRVGEVRIAAWAGRRHC